MRGAYRLLTVAGIEVRVHWSFVLILAFGALSWASAGVPGMLFGAATVLALFTCVTLHELGHSLVARRFGVGVREIVLWPLGGIAKLDSEPRRPLHEVWIALAGPAVNMVIAVVLIVAFPHVARAPMDADLAPMREVSLAALIATLASANIMLALFNLLPAFPLDGGRVLRGLLAWRLGSSRATRIATVVGKVVAVGLGVLAVTGGSLVLALIAVFIYFGATAEQNEHRTRDALAGLRAGDATNRGALSLSPADQVGAVASLLVRTPQRDFPVVHGESLVGIVSRDLVLAALRAGGPSQYVAGVMDRGPLAIDAALALPDARRFMMERGQRVAAVFDGSHFVGLLSLEDLAEVALVQEAARAPGRTGSVTDRPA